MNTKYLSIGLLIGVGLAHFTTPENRHIMSIIVPVTAVVLLTANLLYHKYVKIP